MRGVNPLTVALTAGALVPLSGLWAAVTLVAWGVAYGAVPVCSQAWFARAAPDAPEAATVVFTASFQATISAGALAGGFVVDAVSVPAVMTCGGVAAAVAALGIAAVAALGIAGAGRRAPDRAFR